MSRMATPGSLLPGGFVLGRLSHADRVGLVYRAHHSDSRDGRAASALVLHPLHVDELREWFEKMAVLGRSLRHANLVEVYALGYTANELPVVVTEWVEGKTARNELASGRVFAPNEVARILREAASALDYLHRRTPPVLHRVIMPETVLLSAPNGTVKLLAIGHADRPHHPAAKPSYLSPEELSGEGELSPASDVFSLASLAYELLTGAVAFNGNGPTILAAVYRGAFPRIGVSSPENATEVDAVLHRAWSIDPQRRFPTAGAFADALGAALEQLPGSLLSTRRSNSALPMRAPTFPAPGGTAPAGSTGRFAAAGFHTPVPHGRTPAGTPAARGANPNLRNSPHAPIPVPTPRSGSHPAVLVSAVAAAERTHTPSRPTPAPAEGARATNGRAGAAAGAPLQVDAGDALISMAPSHIDDPEVLSILADETTMPGEKKDVASIVAGGSSVPRPHDEPRHAAEESQTTGALDDALHRAPRLTEDEMTVPASQGGGPRKESSASNAAMGRRDPNDPPFSLTRRATGEFAPAQAPRRGTGEFAAAAMPQAPRRPSGEFFAPPPQARQRTGECAPAQMPQAPRRPSGEFLRAQGYGPRRPSGEFPAAGGRRSGSEYDAARPRRPSGEFVPAAHGQTPRRPSGEFLPAAQGYPPRRPSGEFAPAAQGAYAPRRHSGEFAPPAGVTPRRATGEYPPAPVPSVAPRRGTGEFALPSPTGPNPVEAPADVSANRQAVRTPFETDAFAPASPDKQANKASGKTREIRLTLPVLLSILVGQTLLAVLIVVAVVYLSPSRNPVVVQVPQNDTRNNDFGPPVRVLPLSDADIPHLRQESPAPLPVPHPTFTGDAGVGVQPTSPAPNEPVAPTRPSPAPNPRGPLAIYHDPTDAQLSASPPTGRVHRRWVNPTPAPTTRTVTTATTDVPAATTVATPTTQPATNPPSTPATPLPDARPPTQNPTTPAATNPPTPPGAGIPGNPYGSTETPPPNPFH